MGGRLLALTLVLTLCINSIAVLNFPSDALSSNSIGIYKSFLKSAVTGALSNSITQHIISPIDAVRHKVRTDMSLTGKPFHRVVFSIFGRNRDRFWPVRVQDRNILRGFGVATLGYSIRGFCRFGFYDAIKESLRSSVKDEHLISRANLPILIVSMGLAEVLATCITCPFEATRMVILKNPKINQSMLHAMHSIIRSEGLQGLFRGFHKTVFRQVPYSCARIASYDLFSDTLRQTINLNETYSETKKALKYLSNNEKIQLLSGISAGAVAATVSKPIQNILSASQLERFPMRSRLIQGYPRAVVGAFEGFAMNRNHAAICRSNGLMLGALAAIRFVLCEQELVYLKCASAIDKLL